MERTLRSAAATATATGTISSQEDEKTEKVLILKLRKQTRPHLKWSEDTVDNENMGKKSSKRCCIYHKNKTFAESDSDESDSDVEIAARQPRKPGAPPNYQRFHA